MTIQLTHSPRTTARLTAAHAEHRRLIRATDEHRRAIADAVAAAHDARLAAERELRKREIVRDHTAHALELNLSPMTLDEARRERLRAAYAAAANEVEAGRQKLARAVALENAAQHIADAIEEGQSHPELIDGLIELLGARQRSRVRDASPRVRVSRTPSPARAARRG